MTTGSYGKTPTLSSVFTDHAAVLLRWRHKSPLNGQCDVHPQLDSNLKFKDIRRIRREVYDTFPDCSVDWIEMVNSPQMYGMYLLRKEEMHLDYGGADDAEEMLLYHVTSESRAMESLESGLDWRRTRRSRYGCGVSFSDDAEYADKYADDSTGEDSRVIMICSVLIKEKHEVYHNWNSNVIVPPGMADTTVSPDDRVYVKYNDFDFYPLYLVHYTYKSDNYQCVFKSNNLVINVYRGYY